MMMMVDIYDDIEDDDFLFLICLLSHYSKDGNKHFLSFLLLYFMLGEGGEEVNRIKLSYAIQ